MMCALVRDIRPLPRILTLCVVSWFAMRLARLSFRKMANPVVDLRVMGHEAQSESEKALTPDIVDPDEKNKPEPGEFFIYLRTLFTFLVSAFVGCAMCWLSEFTACTMSGLITVKWTSLPTIFRYSVGSKRSN